MKIYSYFAILVFTLLALIPSVDIVIKNPPSHYWPWMIVIAGFLGVFTLFIKTSWPVRVIAIVGFIHCFFSAIPYVSFTSYVSLVACCYFYKLIAGGLWSFGAACGSRSRHLSDWAWSAGAGIGGRALSNKRPRRQVM